MRRWAAILCLPIGLFGFGALLPDLADGLALIRCGEAREARVLGLDRSERDGLGWLLGQRYRVSLRLDRQHVTQEISAARFDSLREGGPGAVDVERGHTLLEAVKGLTVALILAAVGLLAAIRTWQLNRS